MKNGKRELLAGSGQLLIIMAIAVVSFLVGANCSGIEEQSNIVEGRFHNTDGSITNLFQLKLATTAKQLAKGLMFVNELKPMEGMLFVFPREEQQTFWMKNTYISLDMVFLDHTLSVVGFLETVPILNEEPRRVEKESKYVVELLAGSVKNHAIAVGSILELNKPLPTG
jgi:uncharacterized membrane protein (UPF0127 family)